jgi:hypothetical protein
MHKCTAHVKGTYRSCSASLIKEAADADCQAMHKATTGTASLKQPPFVTSAGYVFCSFDRQQSTS